MVQSKPTFKQELLSITEKHWLFWKLLYHFGFTISIKLLQKWNGEPVSVIHRKELALRTGLFTNLATVNCLSNGSQLLLFT